MDTVWILRNDRAGGYDLEKCSWHFTTPVLLHWLKVLSVSVCSALSSHISSYILLTHLSRLSLFHRPPTLHVDLNNGCLSSLHEQLSLMRTLAADRASVCWEPLISLWKMDAGFFPHLQWGPVTMWQHTSQHFFYLKMLCEVTAAQPHCITKLSTFIFLACTIKQKLLLMSNFNSEQQPTAAWWDTADGWNMLYSPCGHIDLNSALAGWMVEAHHVATWRSKHSNILVTF